MRYKTVLFDLDGTIIDTNELILASYLYVLEKHFPGKYRREQLIPYMGEPLLDQMERFGGAELRDLMVDTYKEYNERVHDQLVRDFPHVPETLEALKNMGVTMGIVTTKQRKTAEMGAKRYGLDKFMSTFIVLEDTERHKPDPEPVLKAMQKVNADPSTTLMVGDSQFDIEAAHHAGIHAAGVSWSLKGADFLRQFQPEYMLEDMRDLISIVKGD